MLDTTKLHELVDSLRNKTDSLARGTCDYQTKQMLATLNHQVWKLYEIIDTIEKHSRDNPNV